MNWFTKLFRRSIDAPDPSPDQTSGSLDADPIDDTGADFMSDAPLTDPVDDRFGRWPFSQRVAETIARRSEKTSLVVGVYGDWGEGKTTVLNFVERTLANEKDTIVVRFNPWRVGDEASLVLSFFSTLAQAIEAKLQSGAQKIGELLRDYGPFLVPLSLGLPGISVDVGSTLRELGLRLSTAKLEEMKHRVGEELIKSRTRVVVFVDDIDRLTKKEIQALFRLVKLSADFENTSYLLAFDPDLVANALQDQYGTDNPNAGRDFLEKIVTVPLQLPKATDEALLQLCFDGVNEALNVTRTNLTEGQAAEFAQHFSDGFSVVLSTPRIAKRYTNAILFALPILRDETNPVDLMLVEALRIFYPGVYDHVRKNRDLYLQIRYGGLIGASVSEAQKAIEDKELSRPLESLSPLEQQKITDLLHHLFPSLRSFGAVAQEDLSIQQRVASRDYFSRYFTYSVPSHDVPDSVVQRLVESAGEADFDSLTAALSSVLARASGKLFLKKIMPHVNTMSDSAARVMALVLSHLGHLFPDDAGLMGIATVERAADIISSLVGRIPAADRRNTAKNVVETALPLGFALSCVGRLIDEKNQVFPAEEDRDYLKRALADRLQREAMEEPLHISQPEKAGRLYYVWAEVRGRDETNEFLRARLEEYPHEVHALLWSLTGRVYPMGGSAPYPGDFDRSNYDFMVKFVDPEAVFAAFLAVHDSSMAEARYIDHYEAEEQGISRELALARQFAAVHRHVIGERTEGGE